MNLTASRGQYYSSVHGDETAKGFKLGPGTRPSAPKSPVKRTEDGSKGRKAPMPKVTTPLQFAGKIMKSTARSVVPKRFLLSSCSPNASIKGRGLGNDLYQDDDITPVIFYADEDAVIRKAPTISFVDPFAFETRQDPISKPKKKTTVQEQGCSPTSVIAMGLFTVEEETIFANYSDDEEEAVFLDDPFFPRSLTRVFDENTSIDISESIQSINAPSVCDKVKYGKQNTSDLDADACSESSEQWFGFFNAESFATCEWDPELEDEAFE